MVLLWMLGLHKYLQFIIFWSKSKRGENISRSCYLLKDRAGKMTYVLPIVFAKQKVERNIFSSVGFWWLCWKDMEILVDIVVEMLVKMSVESAMKMLVALSSKASVPLCSDLAKREKEEDNNNDDNKNNNN